MFENIKRLYNEGKLSDDGLIKAIDKGWITEEERDLIIEGGAG